MNTHRCGFCVVSRWNISSRDLLSFFHSHFRFISWFQTNILSNGKWQTKEICPIFRHLWRALLVPRAPGVSKQTDVQTETPVPLKPETRTLSPFSSKSCLSGFRERNSSRCDVPEPRRSVLRIKSGSLTWNDSSHWPGILLVKSGRVARLCKQWRK